MGIGLASLKTDLVFGTFNGYFSSFRVCGAGHALIHRSRDCYQNGNGPENEVFHTVFDSKFYN
jgi:hypothetical protein